MAKNEGSWFLMGELNSILAESRSAATRPDALPPPARHAKHPATTRRNSAKGTKLKLLQITPFLKEIFAPDF